MKYFASCSALVLLAVSLSGNAVWAWGGKKAPVEPVQKFKREDFMLMNLNRGETSTGGQISAAARETKAMVKVLDKALRQLEQVDKEYAKAKGKPDDHYLFQPADRLRQALKTAQQLSTELDSARDELKDSINQTMVIGQ